MRFVCESCRAQYMINDDKVGPKGVKVRCRKCGYVILVKRTDAAKGGNGPVALANDPDDAMATQVMQTPLGGPDVTLGADNTSPGTTAPEDRTQTSGPDLGSVEAKGARAAVKDSLLGADDDEIGAVFDQVLRTGPTAIPKDGMAEKSDDDRQSTRVIDADTVRKLAEESSGKKGEVAAVEKKVDAVPETDWYVAIDDKQTGPLTLEKLKEYWDRGEIGPDSLCWRAGFDDWIPVSEAKMLASVLAPQPPKPIVVAPSPVAAPAIVSVPVQSAFSAGGVVQTVQSQVSVPLGMAAATAEREDTGTWRPTAASALAALVKDEMEALAKPPPKAPPPAPDDVPMTRGLLDLPVGDEKASNGGGNAHAEVERPRLPVQSSHAPAPVNPYLANPGATFSAPAMTQYRPPSNRNVILAISVGGGFMVLVLIALVVWLATRQPVVVAPPPIAVTQPPVVQAPPAQPVAEPPPTQPVAQPPRAQSPVTQPTSLAVAQEPPSSAPAPLPPPSPTQPELKKESAAKKETRVAAVKPTKSEAAEPKQPKEPKETPRSAGGTEEDEFASAFGPAPKEPAPKREVKSESTGKKDVYVPPPPGGAPAKESLGQADIMEVVLASKGALAKCAEQQRAKDPSTSGKLVMRWTIQTSGKTTNVGVVSEEFKGTYMATCVAGIIKGWQFPKHKQQGEPVTFPFKF
jgi:predicted Zn finger-like uncharacterized protein